MDLALAAVGEAFKAHGEGRANMPPKAHLVVARGSFKAMYGEIFLPDGHICGVKWNANLPENPREGRPAIFGKILLNDPATGLELADMDSTVITRFRTGAAGGLAVRLLSRPDARRLGLVGAGEQARTQVAAIVKMRDIREITVYSRSLAHAQRLGDEIEAGHGIAVRAVDRVADAVTGQDIVVTVTPSTRPLVRREWVAPGTHINAFGADSPGKEELDPAVLATAKVVVDDVAQAVQIGEINVPLTRGEFRPEQIYGTLGEILTGKKPGREAAQEITMFDATGLAIQDLALGWAVYKLAKEKGLGEEKDFLR
jgi:alanine dehydrogenase